MGSHMEKNVNSQLKGKISWKGVLVDKIGWLILALIIVISSLSQQYVQKIFSEAHFTITALSRDAKRDMRITELLYHLKDKTDSDRAWVFLFHNGAYGSTGIPFKKVSCFYEVVTPGVSRELNNSQNVGLTSIPVAIDLLVKNNDAFFINVSQLRTGLFKSMCEAQGTKYMIWHRLMIGEQFLGIVGVDYVYDIPPPVIQCFIDNLNTGTTNNITQDQQEYLCTVDSVANLIEFEFMKKEQ